MRAAAVLLLGAMATAPGGAAEPQPKTEASIAQLEELVATRYSHRDVRAVDWDSQRTQFTPRLLATKPPREFAVTAGELPAATRDPHIGLTEAGKIVPAFRRQACGDRALAFPPGHDHR